MASEERRAEAVARNQALMREVNERIERIVEDAADPEFLCECGEADCIETLHLSIGEYESIRSSPNRFPIKWGTTRPPSSGSSRKTTAMSSSRRSARRARSPASSTPARAARAEPGVGGVLAGAHTGWGLAR